MIMPTIDQTIQRCVVAVAVATTFLLEAAAQGPQPAGGSAATLDVADGLTVTLACSEPAIRSLTNIDVDHRGRVWACEVVNYRRNNGRRPEGDRILILEDRDGDGVFEHSHTYYQGRDVDSAMGICVLGNRVIVSCSPNIWVFTDEDGDDRPDRKEALFTNTGRAQHDHSAHAFVFGPDGKLYWNFGNTGQAVHDANGQPVRDRWGRTVQDDGRPYRGGMVFRCDADGQNFDVLAHNFRNNYEVCVDSFGGLWQSDNDDDGNKSVRINYVLEGGNYGYREEGTGRGWASPRTNLEATIPLRHWHQNDPGVVPNLLITGAGSPTGIVFYEGSLLPTRYRGQMIHCDAGPNIVRCYSVQPDGAGFHAQTLALLHGARDKWFRPADVCVAPDGSLLVADWYDPGVGGHGQGDIDRGRLYRVAPPNTPYRVPSWDFDQPHTAVAALKSPNQATRYLAWNALHKAATEAEPVLLSMFRDEGNAAFQARALWLLSHLPNGATYLREASKHVDPRLRIVALRAVRQLENPHLVDELLSRLSTDEDPAVRRECAVALRHRDDQTAHALWAQLAARYRPGDRWSLEALGIGAKDHWEERWGAWRKLQPQLAKSDPHYIDLLWRSRRAETAAEILSHLDTTDDSKNLRFFRSLDFAPKESLETALDGWLEAQRSTGKVRDRASDFAEVLLRCNTKSHSAAWAIHAFVGLGYTAPRYIDVVARFPEHCRSEDLLAGVTRQFWPDPGPAVRMILERGNKVFSQAIQQAESVDAVGTLLNALGQSGDERALPLLWEIVQQARDTEQDSVRDQETRRLAAREITRFSTGANELLNRVEQGVLSADIVSAIAFPLLRASDGKIRARAQDLIASDEQGPALPPLRELMRIQGDAHQGKRLFEGRANCSKCHNIANSAASVGPNLATIGSKLSREAMWESILFPERRHQP